MMIRTGRAALLALALLTTTAACNRARHTTKLAYAGADGRNTVAALEAEIGKRGHKAICAEQKYCKFKPEENLWIHFKTSEKRVVLAVDVMGADEMPPDQAKALKDKGEKLGQEIWQTASKASLESEKRAAAAAQAAKAEQERRDAAAAKERANNPPPAPPPGFINPMDRMKARMKIKTRVGVGKKPERAGGTTKTTSSTKCCVNGAFYACPDAASFNKCGGETARCMMKCMQSSDMSCPDKCLKQHPPDPSGCKRELSRDSECKR